MIQFFQNKQKDPADRAFLYGDGIWVTFYLRNSLLILAEESYFYVMASMRKLRMDIPQSYTLEFFTELLTKEVIEKGVKNARIKFFVYRASSAQQNLAKNNVEFYFEVQEVEDILKAEKDYELDLIKEINVNTNLFSNIHVHSPENIYADIYAKENDLDDVILLNPEKRVARTSQGNILLINENTIRIPKLTEGAYISPLLESFVQFLDKNRKALISESEIIAFETQKADEILLISETTGIHHVTKVRNKEFKTSHFQDLLQAWRESS
ncbi:aminotransferase class IV [Elizabethkingia sp. JS20170427COW]|uniref:aminotransferase class IV n=1 Tax=Elizabethkingia sp. JS20170427COW TaxID=2583851 RepID=UPI001110191F|nr:aminotransferase class IV [Elizabethkingia sp. JS20170427COW]QCX53587.1 aminodeoxychorismate lyase [Elizabethkingia sp. JS20170427COW]